MGKLLVFGLFALGISGFFYFDFGRFASLAALQENKDALLAYTAIHPSETVIFYILIYTLQTALSLPGATILTLASGFLFGSLLGTLYVNIGATLGATIAFLSARYLLHDFVERKFSKKLTSLQAGFSNNAFQYLLTLRLIPLFPFFLVNLAAGLTKIRVTTYAGATALGIIPASFVYSNAGTQLGNITSVKDIGSPKVLGAFVLLGLLAVVPIIYKRLQKSSSKAMENK
jgi:uncharacterized membrane protein YdjX (TVP38/TMEM64 family)